MILTLECYQYSKIGIIETQQTRLLMESNLDDLNINSVACQYYVMSAKFLKQQICWKCLQHKLCSIQFSQKQNFKISVEVRSHSSFRLLSFYDHYAFQVTTTSIRMFRLLLCCDDAILQSFQTSIIKICAMLFAHPIF